MNLDKRQKMLVGVLAGVLLLWQGSGVLWSIFFGPFDSRNQQIAALEQTLKTKRDADDNLKLTEHRTRNWERRSLPPNPIIASTLYHFWISDLASANHFERLTVTPKRISTGTTSAVFTRIPISITAECKMEELCKFLYDFYRTDLMHKVTHIGLESLDSKANPVLKVSLELEGLSLASAKPRNTLFGEKQDKAVSDAMSKKTLDDYKPLTAQNRFARGYNGPPKPADPPAPPAAPFDSAPYTKLVACIEDGNGELQAWLLDMSSNKNTVIYVGKEFEVAGVKGMVVEIGKRSIKLVVKDKLWQLEIGESLKQMVEVKGEATKSVPITATPEVTPKSTLTSPMPTTAVPPKSPL